MNNELQDFSDKIDKFFMENSKEVIEESLRSIDNMKFESPTLDEIFEEQVRAERKLKSLYKKKLKGLINVRGVFRHLGDNTYWEPQDIVDIELTDETTSGYRTYQHARIKGDESRRLYMKTPCDEIRNVDHYYVWQTTGYCEDDYSGWLLFPLKDGRYFKAYYSC